MLWLFHLFQVNLGVIFKEENKEEDMIDIVTKLHGLVPGAEVDEIEVFDHIPFVGDLAINHKGCHEKSVDGISRHHSVKNQIGKFLAVWGSSTGLWKEDC